MLCLLTVCAFSFHQKTNYQLRSLTNILIGLNDGDYSMRGIHLPNNGALAELVAQMNQLTDTLAEQRFIAHESQLLVSKIIQHIDVAIIAIDQEHNIALLNPAAETLLATEQQQAIGKPLTDFNAQALLDISTQQVTQLSFLSHQGKYQVIRDHYREQGQQHDLYFITNVQDLLREHERQSWQNLIRVLSHEINNSLSPIASLANTLKTQANKQKLDAIYSDNLDIISARAQRLKGFVDSYRQVSFLPKPTKQTTDITKLVNNILPLFPNREIILHSIITQPVNLDSGQIEQVMINLIKNADEAMMLKEESVHLVKAKTPQAITISIGLKQEKLQITVVDQGKGLSNTENLFTPFYSTKKQGSGIGLLLSRQIIEGHGGHLTLNNRQDVKESLPVSGCVAEIILPVDNIPTDMN